MNRYQPIGMRRFLDRACARHAGSVFLHFRGAEWTYAQLGEATDAAAAGLRELGLGRGARVAMLLPTGPDHVFAWLAVVKAGAVATPIHTDLSPAEVAAVLDHLEPAALIHDRALAGKLTAVGPDAIRLRIEARDGAVPDPPLPPPAARLSELLSSRRALEGVEEPGPDEIAEILTTSGTSGWPKATMIPHRMPVLTGEAFAHWLGLGSKDRLFTCLPMSHINARHYSCLGAIAAGASLALEERFSASRFWGWLAASGATQFNAIGAMLRILLERPEMPADRAHRVRLVYAAPALGSEAHVAFERRFGARLVIGYGLTESTFGFIHSLSGPRNLDGMGRPRRHPDLSVAADARLVVEDARSKTWRDAAPQETGEIWLRNPATFTGYYRDAAATAAAFSDGWLRTGDLARRDEQGEYVFAGRLKQVIRRRGENLTPAEVEAVIEAHPAVLEAAVIGVPSPLGEDDVRACVALRPGATAIPEDLAAFCAERLAAFKVPTQWRFLDRLPRTPTQRVAYPLLPRD